MYQKLKSCLFNPKKIVNYVDEPKKKSFWYTFFLVLVYILPIIIVVVFSTSISSGFSDHLVNSFTNGNEIHYNLESGKLKKTQEDVGTEYVSSNVSINKIDVSIGFVFDLTENNYHVESCLQNHYYILFVLSETKITAYYGYSANSGKVSGGQQVSNSSGGIEMQLFTKTYEQLNLTDVNFNNALNKESDFEIQAMYFVNKVYSAIKFNYLPIIIISLMLVYIAAYFLLILIITLIEKLVYFGLGIPFKKVFKIVILCSTPYVIFSLISIFTNLNFISIIGEILMVIYTMIVIMSYRMGNIRTVFIKTKDEHNDDKNGGKNDEL